MRTIIMIVGESFVLNIMTVADSDKDDWILFTVGNVDREISVDIAVDTRSIVGRHSVDSRSIVGR